MRRDISNVPGNPLVHFLVALFMGTLGLGSAAYATPAPTDIILDHGPQGTCGNSTTACYGAGASGNDGINPNVNDVIGTRADFDVKSIQFTTWTNNHIVGDILFNYHSGDASLADFVDFGFTLKVGDLLFNAGGHDFGIALTGHDGLTAGQLYEVSGFLTSDQFGLNHNSVIWRDAYWCAYFGGSGCTTPAVRMNSAGATALGTLGTVTVTHDNEGLFPTGIELDAHIDFNPGGVNGSFWQTYLTNNGLDTSFAAAICANDIVQGHITPGPAVPEPSTWLLFGSGLAGLVVWRRQAIVSTKP